MIINADDLGLCSGVNRAVAQAVGGGVLTSATLMVNGNAAEEAVEIAKGTPELGVGVHLNLTEGRPVSAEAGALCSENGEFRYSAGKLAVMSVLSGSVRAAIKRELAAQVEWVLSRGIEPTHLDSHKHVHTAVAIYPIIVRLAEQFGVSAIRWPFEPRLVGGSGWPLPSKGGKKRASMVSFLAKVNRRCNCAFIKNDSFVGLRHTGKMDTVLWQSIAAAGLEGVVEVMVHPGFADGLDPAKTRLIEARYVEYEALCDERTKRALADAGIELVHYGKL